MAITSTYGVGTRIGPYRVEHLLGRGGMGVVYRATDLRLGRAVALKLLSPELAEDRRFRARFERESLLAASIDHAGIVPVYEAGEADGVTYIAMRYVDGSDLARLLRHEGPFKSSRALDLVGQLAEALDAAHARGLVHRDVKASNTLIAREGAREGAYLADFGLTRANGPDSVTATGQVRRGGLRQAHPDDRTGLRRHQIQPPHRPLPTPRQSRLSLGMAPDPRHPQPAQALAPHQRPRGGLRHTAAAGARRAPGRSRHTKTPAAHARVEALTKRGGRHVVRTPATRLWPGAYRLLVWLGRLGAAGIDGRRWRWRSARGGVCACRPPGEQGPDGGTVLDDRERLGVGLELGVVERGPHAVEPDLGGERDVGVGVERGQQPLEAQVVLVPAEDLAHSRAHHRLVAA